MHYIFVETAAFQVCRPSGGITKGKITQRLPFCWGTYIFKINNGSTFSRKHHYKRREAILARLYNSRTLERKFLLRKRQLR